MEKKKTSPDRLFYICTIVVLLAILASFFYGAFIPDSILFGHDTINIYMPFKIFAKEVTAKFHDIPLWMPNLFFGFPLIASSSLLYYYPTDLISIILNLNVPSFYTIDLIIHLLVAFFGMYLFLRQTGIRREAALFGGVAIMLSGYIITYVNAGHWNNIKAGALIPFIFYFIEKALAEKKLLHIINASIFLALQVLATGMQIMAYTYLAVILYISYRLISGNFTRAERIKTVIWLVIGIVFIILLSALQFLPSMGYTKYSWREAFTYKNFTSWSMHPVETLAMLLPNFFGIKENYYGYLMFNLTSYYIGIMPFLLLPFAFVDSSNRKNAFFLLAVSFLMLILSFGGYTFIYPLFYYVPVFKQFRNPARFMYLFSFFIVIIAGIGLNNIFNIIQKNDKKSGLVKYFIYTAIVTTVVAVVLLLMSADSNLYSMVGNIYKDIKNQNMSPQLMGVIANGIKEDVLFFWAVSVSFFVIIWLVINKKLNNVLVASLLLVIIHVADVYRIDKKFVVYEPFKNYVQPLDPIGIYLKNDNDIFRVDDFSYSWGPNKNLYYNVEGVNGMHGLMPTRYIKMEKEGMFNILAVDNYFNIKYMIMTQEIKIPGVVKVVDGAVKLYQNSSVMPRFDFTDRVIKLGSQDEILQYMKSGKFDFKGVLISEDMDWMSSPEQLSYTIAMHKYTPNRIEMKIEAGKEGVLVIKNSYYPEWKVKVDKKQGKIYNVNYGLIGIPLKKGTHEIVLYYDKSGFYLALIMTLLGIILYGFILIKEIKKTKGKQ